MYSVKINEFEGPLDLLLHLIKESNINIYDISIDEITKQYLDYINQMEKLDIEVASEYLVMASELMLIKSKSLLPNEKEENIDDEEEELSRDNLINRLIEYQKYKELTKNFKELELERRNIHIKAPSKISNITNTKFINDTDTTVTDLINAFSMFLERKNKEKPLNTKVTNKEYSVKKRKNDIKNYLIKNNKAKFSDLFDIYNKSYIVTTFIAILELAKERQINLKQENNFEDIYMEINKD